jgi:sugar phosphate permease
MFLSSSETAVKSTKYSFKYWQSTTVMGLFIGYTGYYICRSNLSVAAPLIMDEYPAINKEVMGQIASLGVVFYAVGKVFNGILGDFIGGKKCLCWG